MNRKTIGTAALVAAMTLGGCAATTDDQQRTKVEGAALGAVIGGLIGYAVDGGRGAAIGAALGAGAGFVVGNEVAKRKQAYATTEDFLDGEIARTDEFNRTTAAYNARVRQDIARLDLESEQLRNRYAAGQVRRDSLQAKRGEIEERISASRQLEETLAREFEVQTAILEQERGGRPADDPYIARLESEVQALQANLEELREGTTQLARIDQRLSV